MTVYPYISVLSFAHPRDGATVEHTCHVEAYSINDAVYQSVAEVEAQHSYIEQGYKMKLLSIRPDTEKARAAITDLLKDIGLLRAPAVGGKQ